MTLSFRSTFAAVVALFALAALDGVAHANQYDDMVAKQVKAQERAAKKMEKLQACAANPVPCAQEDAAKAQKAIERAQKKLEAAKLTLSSN
jgi:hypothetical protein